MIYSEVTGNMGIMTCIKDKYKQIGYEEVISIKNTLGFNKIE